METFNRQLLSWFVSSCLFAHPGNMEQQYHSFWWHICLPQTNLSPIFTVFLALFWSPPTRISGSVAAKYSFTFTSSCLLCLPAVQCCAGSVWWVFRAIFTENSCLVWLKTGFTRAVRVNQNNKVSVCKTETVTWKELWELSGTAVLGINVCGCLSRYIWSVVHLKILIMHSELTN